ncbi:YciI family protein [Actinomadura meridiana]|uniref:YciI family protein n=1 Tax=Actinomadura meridiana TaxID=559626 RepID=A0ABP8C6F9_9ACTN
MKYMLLIFNRPGFVEELSEQERQDLFGDVDRIMRELDESGEWVTGEALADPSTTKTVHAKDGQPAVTDGPFLEAKEHFAGFLTVDCESEERAVEIAKSWPDVRYGGRLEVRAIMVEGGAEM